MKSVIKKLLKEELFDKHSEKQINLLNKFVEFACGYLKIKDPKVVLKFGREGLVTTASYGNGKTEVYAKDRSLVDIMRSIGHELTHMAQDKTGKLQSGSHDKNNAAGSNIENQANSTAGILIRKFGEAHPEIYE